MTRRKNNPDRQWKELPTRDRVTLGPPTPPKGWKLIPKSERREKKTGPGSSQDAAPNPNEKSSR